MAHVNIHSTAFSVKGIAPDAVQELVTGKDDALIFQQQTEQLELLECQADLCSAGGDEMPLRVDLKVAELENLLPSAFPNGAAPP